jgi:hypothetical protein
MTNSVAATPNALTPTETQRASAARATGTSFAQVQAAAVKDTEAKDKTTSTDGSKDTSASAPKGERTEKVSGHGYVEIVAGPRNGMFINNTGSKRDGEAFLIVKRHGREFHVYGTGDERKVYEVGRKRETTDATDTSGTSGTTGTSDTSGTDTTAASGTTGTSSTAATGTTTATGTATA